ncbi:hypothetical protein C8J57DRAFT_571781 [Mycena rebaudengoi]|nr:hypothetical protein C8J57DRAFT_571781 [Mycena rebaudengoi]
MTRAWERQLRRTRRVLFPCQARRRTAPSCCTPSRRWWRALWTSWSRSSYVYAASVIIPVRVKTLTGLLKAVSFLDVDGLKRILTFVPVASFASSILSSKDHPTLVIGALQLINLLLTKVPALYKPMFRREGVFHEIEVLSVRTIISAPKQKTRTPRRRTRTRPSRLPRWTPWPMPCHPRLCLPLLWPCRRFRGSRS